MRGQSSLLSGFDFRDWLLAHDPALSCLRMASRVTLAMALSFGALLAIHHLLFPPPTVSALSCRSKAASR